MNNTANTQTGSGPDNCSTVVKHADEIERITVRAGSAAEMQVLLGEGDRAPHFALRRFIMGKDGGMPRHTNRVEHEQYVLRGRARVGIGNEVFEVSAGNVLLIPGAMPHYYEVVEAPFEFLCIVPNGPDDIQILDNEPASAKS
jgi:quercetin dioxygenase-like cupin family protein